MRRLNITFVILFIVALGVNIFQFVFWSNQQKSTAEKYTAEIATLEQQLTSIGEAVTVYTVASAKKAGDQITSEDIVEMRTYSSLLTDQYVTSINNITDRYFKIAVNPGTPITSNMIMDDELEDSMRDRDIILDRMTVGLREGDYIDIRMTMPYGDDYVVLPHKRIVAINDSTIKLYLTELEWAIYQGAMIDYALNVEYGCSLYADRYIEPGLQQEAIAYYAVPDNIAALLQKNPNIVDKDEAASLNEWRKSIEEILVLFRDESDTIDSDAGKLKSNRDALTSAINSDFSTVRGEQEAEDAANEAATEEEIGDDFWEETAE